MPPGACSQRRKIYPHIWEAVGDYILPVTDHSPDAAIASVLGEIVLRTNYEDFMAAARIKTQRSTIFVLPSADLYYDVLPLVSCERGRQ